MLSAVGFDPYLGFYHKPRFGRPTLALDFDGAVPFDPGGFDRDPGRQQWRSEAGWFCYSGPAVNLKPPARRAFITADERRLDQPTLVGGLHYQYVQT